MTEKICTGAEYSTGKITRRGKCVGCGFCERKSKLEKQTVKEMKHYAKTRRKILQRVKEIAARGRAEVELRPEPIPKKEKPVVANYLRRRT